MRFENPQRMVVLPIFAILMLTLFVTVLHYVWLVDENEILSSRLKQLESELDKIKNKTAGSDSDMFNENEILKSHVKRLEMDLAEKNKNKTVGSNNDIFNENEILRSNVKRLGLELDTIRKKTKELDYVFNESKVLKTNVKFLELEMEKIKNSTGEVVGRFFKKTLGTYTFGTCEYPIVEYRSRPGLELEYRLFVGNMELPISPQYLVTAHRKVRVFSEEKRIIDNTNLELMRFWNSFAEEHGIMYRYFGGIELEFCRGPVIWDDDLDVAMAPKHLRHVDKLFNGGVKSSVNNKGYYIGSRIFKYKGKQYRIFKTPGYPGGKPYQIMMMDRPFQRGVLDVFLCRHQRGEICGYGAYDDSKMEEFPKSTYCGVKNSRFLKGLVEGDPAVCAKANKKAHGKNWAQRSMYVHLKFGTDQPPNMNSLHVVD